jgi:hypothetical protein
LTLLAKRLQLTRTTNLTVKTMSTVVSRWRHHIKVAGGHSIQAILERQLSDKRGLFRKVVSGTSEQSAVAGVKTVLALPPTAIPKTSIAFHLSGPVEARYCELLQRDAISTNQVSVFVAPNVLVSFPTCVHRLSSGHIISECVPSSDALVNPKYYLELIRMAYRTRREAPDGILLAMPWHHNFYHWMLEFLPRLLCLEHCEELKSLPLLIPRSAPRFVRESLQLAGYWDRTVPLDDGVHLFKKLHLISTLAPACEVSPPAIEWLTKALAVPSSATSSPRKIYVSRSDAKIRFVSNEDSLKAILSEFGFVIANMSDHSPAEQIQMFHGAEYVVGPHGAAFANLAFAQPGCTFLEFFSDGHFNGAFSRIAAIKGLRYGFLVGKPTSFGGFSIDPARLRDALTDLVHD